MNEMKRSQSNRHHTVPSPIFPTFPVLREIELRTDINDHHNRHQFSTDRFDDQKILSETDESVPSPDTITSKPYDYGFTLCDKLKMSFSDMQSMKERFEERRRQFPLKKKSIDQKSIVIDKLGVRIYRYQFEIEID